MLIENISDIALLDGNGNAFNQTEKYFNRYQSTIAHDLHVKDVRIKHKKTIGGFWFDRPVAYCSVSYGGKIMSVQFEADFIADNVFGFPQLIPVATGITLEFEYGDSRAYANAVRNITQK